MSRRTERIEGMLREEISVILQRQLKDPRLGFVTITGAEVSPDLRHAKVFVSVLGTPEERDHSLEALNRARGFVRTELSRRAHLKTVPDMVFREDEAAKTGNRIFELLETVRHNEDGSDATDEEGDGTDATDTEGDGTDDEDTDDTEGRLSHGG